MKWLIGILCVVTLALSACGDDDAGVTVLDETDSGSEVVVSSGERFTLRLESNPSTGYAWRIDPASPSNLVELVSSDYEDATDGDVVGASGTEVFVFEAVAQGAGILRLEYLRSFEDLPIPERVVELIVRIDGAPWPPDTEGIEPPSTATAVAPTPTPGAAIEVPALVDGGGATQVSVTGDFDGEAPTLE